MECVRNGQGRRSAGHGTSTHLWRLEVTGPPSILSDAAQDARACVPGGRISWPPPRMLPSVIGTRLCHVSLMLSARIALRAGLLGRDTLGARGRALRSPIMAANPNKGAISKVVFVTGNEKKLREVRSSELVEWNALRIGRATPWGADHGCECQSVDCDGHVLPPAGGGDPQRRASAAVRGEQAVGGPPRAPGAALQGARHPPQRHSPQMSIALVSAGIGPLLSRRRGSRRTLPRRSAAWPPKPWAGRA